ncbi:MAG: lytic transglycosylase domain-containing protein [Betaproteobacteria bacterium]|nr:lytic transglycosylase domain-containing protein [Betaproteobacteria bacterium]
MIKTWLRLVLVAAIVGVAPLAHAYMCFAEAGVRYRVSPILLEAIAGHESGFRPRLVHRNKNGSVDIGLMGINSSWYPRLARFGITPRDLFHECTNIMVGAWILGLGVQRYGMTWKAVGVYNSPDSARYQGLYARYIYAEIQHLLEGGNER